MLDDEITVGSELLVETEVEFPPGTIVDERFRVGKMVGRGGMCAVYEAEHLQLQRHVAIKLLHQRRLASTDAVSRFQREAILASELKHPNIIEILGFGVWKSRPYIVMEFLEGRTLNAIVQEEGPLPEARALQIFLQICQALECAHDHHIVHRDLKPSNVMICSGDQVKLVDFGIARLLPESSDEVQKLTQTGQVLGTFLYMSPEQCMGRPVDARSDLYSFGCLMHKVLEGEPPFTAELPYELMGMHLHVPAPTITKSSARMDAIAKWCLRKGAEDRPQNVGQLKSVFLGEDLKVTVPVDTSPARAMEKSRRLPKWGIVAAVVCVLSIGAAGSLMFMPKSPPPESSPEEDAQAHSLIAAVRKAKKPHDVAMANQALLKFYGEKNRWYEADAAGRAAMEAFEQAGEADSTDGLYTLFDTAVAMQNNGKMVSGVQRFVHICQETPSAPKYLKARAALHAAECLIAMTKWPKANRYFLRAMELTDDNDFSFQQQVKFEYAEFLMKSWDDSDTSDPAPKRKEIARKLLTEVIEAGAPTSEDAQRINNAKILRATP